MSIAVVSYVYANSIISIRIIVNSAQETFFTMQQKKNAKKRENEFSLGNITTSPRSGSSVFFAMIARGMTVLRDKL